MKKFFIVFVSVLLTAGCLAGCTPASEIMVETTTEKSGIIINPNTGNTETSFKDYVVCSDNFAFYAGEYNYFFMQLCSNALEDEEYDIDPNKSLKEQYVADSDKTWFEVIRDLTLDYMKELLYVYELCLSSDSGHISEGDKYLYDYFIPGLNQISGGDPVEYVNEQFGGMVSYQNYLNAIRIEYICDIYISDAIVEKQDELTTSELEKYADSVDLERNDALTKRAICVSISGGKTKAEEFKDSFILSGDISAAGLKAFADKNGNTWFEDVFTNEGENEGAISEWLFNMATDVGSFDTVEVKDSGYYLVFFERTGETVYLYRARQLLAEKTVDEEIKAKTAEYKFNISEEKLNAVNA